MKVLGAKRDKLWERLGRASRGLGLPTLPKFTVGTRVEKDGVVLCERKEEGHSWTRNAWNAFFASMSHCVSSGSDNFGSGYMTVKRNTGAVNYGNYTSVPNSLWVVVGTGDSAFSVEDYWLAAEIADGFGAGQLSRQDMVYNTSTYNAGVWTKEISRVFVNNSGDTIIVKEAGLYEQASIFYAATTYPFLFARDVLSSSVPVVAAAVLTVTYALSMDFSSIDI